MIEHKHNITRQKKNIKKQIKEAWLQSNVSARRPDAPRHSLENMLWINAAKQL